MPRCRSVPPRRDGQWENRDERLENGWDRRRIPARRALSVAGAERRVRPGEPGGAPRPRRPHGPHHPARRQVERACDDDRRRGEEEAGEAGLRACARDRGEGGRLHRTGEEAGPDADCQRRQIRQGRSRPVSKAPPDRLMTSRRSIAICKEARPSGASESEMTACIVGWAHTRFGKHENEDIESLIVRVAGDAVRDAGLAPADIDAVYLGTFNGGFVRQDFPASLVFQADPAFRFKPATRVENACATGSAAIHQGLNAIAAKRARAVLVVGVEKMSEVTGPRVGEILMSARYLKEDST